jgi:hypothetical protein
MVISTKKTRAHLKMATKLLFKPEADLVGEWPSEVSIDSGVRASENTEQLVRFLRFELSVRIRVVPAKDLAAERRWISKIKVTSLQQMAVPRPTGSQDRPRGAYRYYETCARFNCRPMNTIICTDSSANGIFKP